MLNTHCHDQSIEVSRSYSQGIRGDLVAIALELSRAIPSQAPSILLLSQTSAAPSRSKTATRPCPIDPLSDRPGPREEKCGQSGRAIPLAELFPSAMQKSANVSPVPPHNIPQLVSQGRRQNTQLTTLVPFFFGSLLLKSSIHKHTRRFR